MKVKTGKQKVESLIIQLIILLLILTTIFSLALAENDTQTGTIKRTQEISVANIIISIILVIIIVVLGIYFSTEHAVKMKHMGNAKKIASKAKQIVKQAQQEEEEEIEKEEEIQKKSAAMKRYLQKNLIKRRSSHTKLKHKSIISEFETQDDFIEPDKKYLEKKQLDKEKVFVSLNEFGKHKKTTKEKRKRDDKLFDKLSEIAKGKKK